MSYKATHSVEVGAPGISGLYFYFGTLFFDVSCWKTPSASPPSSGDVGDEELEGIVTRIGRALQAFAGKVNDVIVRESGEKPFGHCGQIVQYQGAAQFVGRLLLHLSSVPSAYENAPLYSCIPTALQVDQLIPD